MPPAMMLLGFTRAVSRFLDDQGTASLSETLSVAMENESHPDIEGVLRSTFGSGKDSPWDLDEEVTSIERYFALFEALNWAVSLDDRLTIDWPFEEIAHGRYWCDEFRGGGLIRGLRFARNSVHHDWSLGSEPRSTQEPISATHRTALALLDGGPRRREAERWGHRVHELPRRPCGWRHAFRDQRHLDCGREHCRRQYHQDGIPAQPRSRSPPTTSTFPKTRTQPDSR